MHFYIIKQIIRNIINTIFYFFKRITINLKEFFKFFIVFLIILVLFSLLRGLKYGY